MTTEHSRVISGCVKVTKKFGAKHTAMNGNANCEKSRKISKKVNRFTSTTESIITEIDKNNEICEEFLGMFSRKITKVDKIGKSWKEVFELKSWENSKLDPLRGPSV